MMSCPLRVLFVGHSCVLAMNRSLPRELANDAGFEVTVAAPYFFHGDLRPIYLEPEPVDSPLHLKGLTVRGSRFIHVFQYSSRELRRLLTQGQFDIVHCWEEPYIYAGYQLGRAVRRHSNAKLVYRSAQSLSKRYPPPFSWFERWSKANANGWIAGGGLVFENLAKRGYDPAKGRVLSLAVDTTLFQPATDVAKSAVRAELGLVLAGPLIGFLGRLTIAKGVPLLLQAVEGLPVDLPWSLLLLGSGPEEAHIMNWARRRGLQDRVRVRLVRHDEVPRFLGAMDVLAAPSQTTPQWKEQFGRMLIEAFACGVPVIGSDSGEIPYVIGDAGMIVPEAEPALWTAALTALLTDPARRERLVQLGLARAQEFSAVALAKQYASFYRSLLAMPPISRTNAKMVVKD